MPTVDELKKQILFDGLDDEELNRLGGFLEVQLYERGQPVFAENEDTQGIYLIKRGDVEITRKLPIDLKTKMLITVRNVQNCCEIRKTPNGWRQVLAHLIEGQFFGELSVTEGRAKHSADAEAIDDCELYVLKKDSFYEIEKVEPKTILTIYKNLARVTSKNLRLIDRQLLKLIIGF